MTVKSARIKKFDDEIDLIFVNRGLESLGYIQVDSIIYILIIVQSLWKFQAIQMMCSTWHKWESNGNLSNLLQYTSRLRDYKNI